MAGDIKGITIEINGDSKKLVSALTDVRKQGSDLNKQLKDIDKALKFDPGNSELIAQKQRVLAESVENSKKKLDILKEAHAQAQKQLTSGEIGQDEFDALTREVIKTEDQLKSFNDQLEETEKASSKTAQGLVKIEEKSEELKKQLDEVEKALKLDPGNSELIAQKHRILGEEVRNTKEKVKLLNEELKEAKKAVKNGDMGQEEFEALKRKTIEAKAELKELNKELKETSKLSQIGNNIKEFGGKVTGVGKGLTAGLTAPIMAIGAASLVAFNEVDEGLDTIIKKTGASGPALEDMEKSYRSIAQSGPYAFGSVGEALGELNTQFGFTGEELKKNSELLLQYAEINDTDVTSSIISSKQAMEVFGLEGSKLSMVLDTVTKVAQDTGVSTDKLLDSVRNAGPVAKDMGLNFTETAVLLGNLEKNGIQGEKAISLLTKASVTFAKKGVTMQQGLKDLKDQLAQTSDRAEKLTIASEYFGSKGAVSMLDAIERGALDFEKFGDSAGYAADTVANTFEATLDPVDQFKVAQNNLKLVMSDLGTEIQGALAPILEVLVDKIKIATEWFNGLSPEIKQMVVIVGGLLAVLGPIVVVIGTIVSAVGTLMTVLNPVVLIIGAIIAAGALLIANWDSVSQWAISLGQTISEWFGAIKERIVETWTNVVNATAEKWDAMKTKISTTVDSIKSWMSEKFNAAKETVLGIFDRIRDGISEKITAAKDKVGAIIEKIKGFFNFKFQWPKIPMPYFSVSPPGWKMGDLLKGSIPSLGVNWYDKGGIFKEPAVIGVGEKRPEFVGALDDLRYLIRDELEKGNLTSMEGITIVFENAVINREIDFNTMAQKIAEKTQKELQARGL